LGVHTSLGVSNVSFGLPSREIVNATFFARALENGLSAAIVNPASVEMLKTYYAFLALSAQDENCGAYIRFATETLPALQPTLQPISKSTAIVTPTSEKDLKTEETPLKRAIIKGLDNEADKACGALLEEKEPLKIVDEDIVPALDYIGREYEEKRAYLPQLLMSAEATKRAFERIRLHLLQKGDKQTKKCKILLATVKGDIHDIGKNIVKTLLENYGFDVLDLGRDVSPEMVLAAAQETGAPIVGLSALMTTTVPSMEETITLLRKQLPAVKIMVGGAVLTEEYAKRIGADGYAKDGMGAVRYAEHIYEELCKK
jgi:5-methyltetrahydrofolate--homocysteine methyltransferase